MDLLTAAQPLITAFGDTNWLVHQLVKKPNGKLDKPPLSGFKSSDPSGWVSAADAIAIAAREPDGSAGISFTIVEGMITLDFDNCVAADGTVAPEIAAWIEQLDSFSYRTASGHGWRVVCRNDPDEPLAPGKYTGRLPGGHKVEVFVGPCNFYNTFSAATDDRPITERVEVTLALLKVLGADANTTTPGRGPRGTRSNFGEIGRTSDLGMKAKDVDALIAALKAIPADADGGRKFWVTIGAAMYGATDGSERGRKAFSTWCRSWPEYDPAQHDEGLEKLWESFHASPPRSIGAGTIYALAKQHGWRFPKGNAKADATTPQQLQVEYFIDIKASPIPVLVKRLIATDSLVMIYGPWGASKSFLVSDLLMHVAWGQKWFGRAVDQGPTLLFSLESREGMRRRVAVFRQRYRLHEEALPFAVCFDSIDLEDPVSVRRIIKLIRRENRRLGQAFKIVAIDTMAAALGMTGDEDKAAKMMPIMQRCRQISRHCDGCTVILIHHPGKDLGRGTRGSSAIPAALDTLLEIEYDGNRPQQPRHIVVRKQRDLAILSDEDMFYRLQSIELAGDLDADEPIISAVVVPILDPAELARLRAGQQQNRLTPSQRLALDALHEALEQCGMTPADGKPAERVTDRTAWLEAFRARLSGEETKQAGRHRLRRAQEALQHAGLIGCQGRLVWLRENAASDEDDDEGPT
jgi:hypothetical protein